ncbi:MAG TPA: TonB-dependent receptor [Longimicrobiales bacterium]
MSAETFAPTPRSTGSVPCLLAALIAAAPLVAQEPPQRPPVQDSVIRAAALRVDAVRAAATAGAASALEVQIDSLRAGPAASLAQVMRELPLVVVRTNSRGESQFSLRGSGSDARQVAVLMDGVPLHIGWDDRVDLSVVPAGAATELTLVRGLPSVLHGPNVLGGVVELAVAHERGLVRRSAAVSGEVALDNAGVLALSGSAAAPLRTTGGQWTLRAGAGYRDSPGATLPRGVSEPAPAPESRITGETLRSNTDHDQLNGFVTGRYESAGGAWLSLASSAFRAERGIAAELHTQSPRFWRYPEVARAVTVVSGGTGDRASPFGGRGDAELSIGYDLGRTEIVSYTGSDYETIDDTEESDDRTLTVRALSDQTLPGSGELRLALTYVDTRHDELLSGTARGDYRQRIWSGGAETVWRIPTGVTPLPVARLSIGGAIDGADTPESGDKPALGTLHAWGARMGVTAGSAGGTVLFHAGVSRRARFPALRELYSGALGRFEPNPALRPETLEAAEAGFTWRPESFELQAVGFYRRLEDAIEQMALPDGRRQRVNLGAVRSAGAELLGAVRLGAARISGDLTIQRVRLLREGAAQRMRPEYQPAFMAGVQTSVPLPFGITASADARHVGAQYCLNPDGPGELRLDASTRYDAALARAFSARRSGPASRLELRAAVDNIADSAIHDQCGLPQPGRTLRIQLSVR